MFECNLISEEENCVMFQLELRIKSFNLGKCLAFLS